MSLLIIKDLARQLGVDSDVLVALAKGKGIDVSGGESRVGADEEWAIRKAVLTASPLSHVERAQPDVAASPRSSRWPRMVPAALPGQRPVGKASPPSDLAKVFLNRDDDFVSGFLNPPPRHVRVERAEKIAREWARCLFTAQEAEEWVDRHGSISPDVAEALRAAGLSAGQSTTRIRTERGFVEKLSLAIRVSSEELTAEEAAAEYRAMQGRLA
ncbi:hypothetical protein [Actinoplanes awajinensis]|uniref:hypothetical protein n=1 Tax=Actinoplanes awajinensis TaxID=135946 RepID=UPI000AB108E5|nr:hypothetical protein [Actinoplanes awajinensis]